jgi:hypothetical protein
MKMKDTTNMLYFETRIFLQLIELFDNYNNNCINALIANKKPIFEFSSADDKGQSLKIDKENYQ